MSGRLTGKMALVTGAAQGIGEAICRQFIAEGAIVVLTDVQEDAGETLALELGERATFRRLDVTSEEDWHRVMQEFAGVNVLVNNAGAVLSFDPLHELEPADWRRIVDLNLNSVFLGMHEVIPLMIESEGGSIVNISSMAGIVGIVGLPAYQASKGGVRLLTKNVAITYASQGVRCNSIHPGLIWTPMVENQPEEATKAFLASTPMGRVGQPQDIAFAAVYLASEESSFVTGAEIYIDGGYVSQ